MLIVVDDDGHLYRFECRDQFVKWGELDPRSEVAAMFDEKGSFYRLEVVLSGDWRLGHPHWYKEETNVKRAAHLLLDHLEWYKVTESSSETLLKTIAGVIESSNW